jgi:hypothetical protein
MTGTVVQMKLRKSEPAYTVEPTGTIMVDGKPMAFWLPEGAPPLSGAGKGEDRG